MTAKIPVHSKRHDVFGRAVRETRARRELSQEELGYRATLHRNYVGAIERGEINPTLRVLYKLATGLQLPAWELLKLADERYAEINRPQTHGPLEIHDTQGAGRR